MKILVLLLFTIQISAQVGVNTTDPQQTLHVGSNTGTVRIESLDGDNSPYNAGDVDGDLDFTNNTYNLYVDALGNLTTEFKPLYNSNGSDAVDDAAIPVNFVTLTNSDTDGQADVQITLFEVTVARPAILEVKYNLSFDVYLDAAKTVISDNYARRISTYFVISGVGTRKYGPVSKCYSSGSTLSITGPMYNASTAYIQLPAAGKYDIQFYGEVSSNVKGGGGGTTSKAAYVEFATGYDAIFLRLH
ncbi:hypothetical protein [Aurantibacter sp.]|uniref:hypothetical protein n=1 Tax=Aurantibacter sp. TaxID=2807103 RepID=UPI0035C83DD0